MSELYSDVNKLSYVVWLVVFEIQCYDLWVADVAKTYNFLSLCDENSEENIVYENQHNGYEFNIQKMWFLRQIVF